MYFLKRRILAATLPLFAALPIAAHAAGMVPETSVVIIDEADGEATMKVKNTDARTALLHTVIDHIPDDKETLFVVTPPVARVDPGQTQLVRFMLTNKTPLKTERLARVIFDSIGERKAPNANTVAIRIRQNLPVVMRPKGLPVEREPWKLLKWRVVDGKLQVSNDSPYVVRLSSDIVLKPIDVEAALPNTYLLPGQSTFVWMPKNAEKLPKAATDKSTPPSAEALETMLKLDPRVRSVQIRPATSYGYSVDTYEAKITASEAATSNSATKN